MAMIKKLTKVVTSIGRFFIPPVNKTNLLEMEEIVKNNKDKELNIICSKSIYHRKLLPFIRKSGKYFNGEWWNLREIYQEINIMIPCNLNHISLHCIIQGKELNLEDREKLNLKYGDSSLVEAMSYTKILWRKEY